MSPTPAAVTAMPPPPPGTGSDTYDPWLTAAADLVAAAVEHHDKLPPPRVPTGRPDLDDLEAGTLNVLVSGPGPAATAAAVAAAHHAAYHHQLPTLLYPLRSTLPQIAEHLARTHTGAHLDAETAAATIDALRDCPLYITAGSPVSVTRIHFDAVDPDLPAPRLIVVDAVDLLLPAGAARDLKHLALELNVAVLCTTTTQATTAVAAADVAASVTAAADTIVALRGKPHRRRETPAARDDLAASSMGVSPDRAEAMSNRRVGTSRGTTDSLQPARRRSE